MAWNKSKLDPALVKHISATYALTLKQAALLVRRGVVNGRDLKFFLERDISYIHNPFLFTDMESAVERILAAADGEKVLVFGDRDVDGIVGTSIIVKSLREYDIDVQWRVPLGDSGYGFTQDDVAQAAEQGVTLIITIDCGISSHKEVEHANRLGIDVLIFDHHNVGKTLPDAYAVINPKAVLTSGDAYPFKDMCAASVALKLRMALAFSRHKTFKHDLCLMNIVPLNDAFRFELLGIRNLVPLWKKDITITQDNAHIMTEQLVDLLKNMPITVYNATQQHELMRSAMGGVDLHCYDLQPHAQKHIPAVKGKSLLHIFNKSKFARYADIREQDEIREIDILCKLYQVVSMLEMHSYKESFDGVVDMVALAVVADVMPLVNENRIVMQLGMNKLQTAPSVGVDMLMRESGLVKDSAARGIVDSTTIGWRITPLINASGRMGQADVGVQLLLETDEAKAREYARDVIALNNKRKSRMDALKKELRQQVEKSIEAENSFVCVYNKKIPHTFTGILAGQFARSLGAPCMIIANRDDSVVSGSVRCHKNFQATRFLSGLREYFVDFGGHQAAAGFSVRHEDVHSFINDARREFVRYMDEHKQNIDSGHIDIPIDLELQPNDFDPDEIKALADFFAPYGEAWPPVTLAFSNLEVAACDFMGKNAEHAKFTVVIGKYKVPVLLWNYQESLPGMSAHDVAAKKIVSFIATPKINEYMGIEQINLIVQKLQV